MDAFVTILSASSWIYSKKKLNIENNIVTSNPLMKRKLGLIGALSSQCCCDIIICFRAVQLQWNLPVEPSSPVTSERLLEDTTTDTQYVYIHTHTHTLTRLHSHCLYWLGAFSHCHLFTNRFKFTQHFCPTVNPEALNQLLSTVKSQTNFMSSFLFIYKKKAT